MLKNIEYGLPRPTAFYTKGVYAEEINAIHDFTSGDKDTMRFEYDSPKSAGNAYTTIKNYVKNIPVGMARRKQYLWVFKVESKNV